MSRQILSGSAALVAEEKDEFISVSNSVFKGWQGTSGNRMPNVPFDDIHEAKQITDFRFWLAAIPGRKNHDIGHAQVVNLKHEEFSEGGVNVPRLTVMRVERVIEPEQSASKLVASQTNLLTPRKELGGNGTNNGTTESDKESLLPIHIIGAITGLILLLWWLCEWERVRWIRREYASSGSP